MSTDESSKSPNRAPEQYNTTDGAFEHVEHIQGQHGEGNDNTDTACGLEVENAQVSSPVFGLDIKSKANSSSCGLNC